LDGGTDRTIVKFIPSTVTGWHNMSLSLSALIMMHFLYLLCTCDIINGTFISDLTLHE